MAPKLPPQVKLKATVIGFCPGCNDYVEADLATLRCLQCHRLIIFIPLRPPQDQ